jgi:isocitrate dehydrogenase
MMLNHIGQQDVAENIKNAWACVIEKGIHTPDMYKEGISKEKVGTRAFADAVIRHLGQKPQVLESVEYARDITFTFPPYQRKKDIVKTLKGVDVFIDWKGSDAGELAEKLIPLSEDLQLKMITNRGVKVWPDGFSETFCTDHWRCRYEAPDGSDISNRRIVDLLSSSVEHNIDVIKTENLYTFNGERGYSLGQGQ